MVERTDNVGYRKPPAEHRFKPGISGNPKGRPKGARGFKLEVADALSATITIKEGGRQRRISIAAAALRRLIQKAVSEGNLRAIERLLVLMQQTDAAAPPLAQELEPDDQKLLEDFLARNQGRADHA